MSNTIIPKLSSLVLPCFRLLCFGKVNFLLARSSFGFNKIFVHIYVSNPFMMSNFNSTLTSSMVYMCIFIMLFASFSGVESFDVELKEQKLTVKGNVKPEVVLQTVSKTGKKTSFWDAEPETKEAIAWWWYPTYKQPFTKKIGLFYVVWSVSMLCCRACFVGQVEYILIIIRSTVTYPFRYACSNRQVNLSRLIDLWKISIASLIRPISHSTYGLLVILMCSISMEFGSLKRQLVEPVNG